jgi:hypothetical protein
MARKAPSTAVRKIRIIVEILNSRTAESLPLCRHGIILMKVDNKSNDSIPFHRAIREAP